VQFIDTRLNAETGLVVCGCAGMTTGVEAATSVALLGETDATGVCSEASAFAYVCRVARSDCVVSGGKNVEKVAVLSSTRP
jgi:hypothetical protein